MTKLLLLLLQLDAAVADDTAVADDPATAKASRKQTWLLPANLTDAVAVHTAAVAADLAAAIMQLRSAVAAA